MSGFDEMLLDGLRALVGGPHVLTGPDLGDPGIDARNLGASAVVAPGDTAQVSAVLALCNAQRVPVVPHGGRTGLAGGATSVAGQVVVSTERLTAIEAIEPEARLVRVGAGVTLRALQDATAEHGLAPGIDLGARDTATIAGMIATNAGGNEAFRNGVMRQRIVGLEFVTATGAVIGDLKRVTKANEGYDLKQLIIGSEGTLGIITRAVLRLEPEAQAGNIQTVLAACADAARAVTVFSRLRGETGITLRAAEAMWPAYAATTSDLLGLTALHRFLSGPAGVFAIFEAECHGADGRSALDRLLEGAFEDGSVSDAVIASSARERAEIWTVREDSWQIERHHPYGAWYDVSVPIMELDRYLHALEPELAAIDADLMLFTFGHLGDGNLHLTITAGRDISDLYARITDAVHAPLAALGGSFSAEHGIGAEKLGAMRARVSDARLDLMAAIKRAFDPNGIMNPGKVLPE